MGADSGVAIIGEFTLLHWHLQPAKTTLVIFEVHYLSIKA